MILSMETVEQHLTIQLAVNSEAIGEERKHRVGMKQNSAHWVRWFEVK